MDNIEETLEAKWIVDNETGRQYLVEFKTGKILACKVDGVWQWK